MMRVYIAGPMTGIPAYNFPAFDAAEALLRQQGDDPVNPAAIDRALDGFDPVAHAAQAHEHYMRRDLPLVAGCDAIALLPGWERSTGARSELTVALLCGRALLSVVCERGIPIGVVSLPRDGVVAALLDARPAGAIA